ncbi:MAG: DUF5711 family protein [Clostridia bacterium]
MKKVIEFKQNKKINKKKIGVIIAISILAILLVVTIILYNGNKNFRNFMDKYIFRKNVTEENIPMIEIDYDSNINIIPYNKYICILAENTLSQYNSSGKKEKEVKIEINNPIYDTENKYLVIGEKDNQKLYLISEDHIIWEKSIDGNLSRVTVNKNGYVCAIVTGTTHKSVIITYDEKGNELFKNYLSNTIAIDACISPDNSNLAYAEINYSGTAIQSNIKIMSIKEATKTDVEPKYIYNALKNQLVLKIKYQNKDNLICMYDDSIYKINNGQSYEILSLNEEINKITFADIELNDYIFRTYEKSTGIFSADTVVELKNISNDKETVYTVEEVVKSVDCSNNIMAFNLGNEVDFVNTSGWLVKRYYSSQVIKNIVLGDGVAGIVYRDKIELINL